MAGIVLPGDVTEATGRGTRQITDGIFHSTKCGVECHGEVLSRSKVYAPRLGDEVLGVVVRKNLGDFAILDLHSHKALLSLVAFNGATKRSKPQLEVGNVIYCRVEKLAADGEDTIVTCVDPKSRKGWQTGEVMYGPREEGGCTVDLGTVAFAERLQQHKKGIALDKDQKSVTIAYLLKKLRKCGLAHELSIGANGVAWVKGKTPTETMRIMLILGRSHLCGSEAEIQILFQQILANGG